MARAQNDMYMVCPDGSKNDDNTLFSLASGELKRGELQRNAKNICYFAMNTNAMNRLSGNEDHIVMINRPDAGEEVSADNVEVFRFEKEITIPLDNLEPKRGTNFVFITETDVLGIYDVSMTAASDSGELAQIPVTLFILGIPCGNFTFSGSSGTPVTITKSTPIYSRFTTMRLYFGQGGIKPKCLTFKLKEKSEKYGNT